MKKWGKKITLSLDARFVTASFIAIILERRIDYLNIHVNLDRRISAYYITVVI